MNDEKVNIDIDKIVKHWIDTSEDDFQTMMSLFNSKSYSWSLFLGLSRLKNYLKQFMSANIKNMPLFSIISID